MHLRKKLREFLWPPAQFAFWDRMQADMDDWFKNNMYDEADYFRMCVRIAAERRYYERRARRLNILRLTAIVCWALVLILDGVKISL